MICTGNICRSPMAKWCCTLRRRRFRRFAVFVNVTERRYRQLARRQPDGPSRSRRPRSCRLRGRGISRRYADRAYLDRQDFVIGMTREHVHEVKKRLSNPSTEVILMRNLTEPGRELDLFDPYYGDDAEFDECLEMVRAGVSV